MKALKVLWFFLSLGLSGLASAETEASQAIRKMSWSMAMGITSGPIVVPEGMRMEQQPPPSFRHSEYPWRSLETVSWPLDPRRRFINDALIALNLRFFNDEVMVDLFALFASDKWGLSARDGSFRLKVKPEEFMVRYTRFFWNP